MLEWSVQRVDVLLLEGERVMLHLFPMSVELPKVEASQRQSGSKEVSRIIFMSKALGNSIHCPSIRALIIFAAPYHVRFLGWTLYRKGTLF